MPAVELPGNQAPLIPPLAQTVAETFDDTVALNRQAADLFEPLGYVIAGVALIHRNSSIPRPSSWSHP
jgi:hypothetical protein